MHTLPELARRLRPSDSLGVDDDELLRRFAEDRDEAAFELLVWRHGGMVLGTCRRVLGRSPDADDAFQVTFLALARRAGSIRSGSSLPGWLHRVARRAAGRLKSAPARRLEQTGRVIRDTAYESKPYDDVGAALDDEIDRLPEKLRLAFVLCHLEGVTNEAAAKTLGCPHGTILSRLSRAREQLRIRLTRRGVAPALLPMSVLSASIGSASVSATTRCAMHYAAGSNSPVVSAHLIALTDELVKSMIVKPRQLTVLAVLTLASVGFSFAAGWAGDRGEPIRQLAADHGTQPADGTTKPEEGFTGTASATGTFKRPLLIVNGKRFELKPSERAEGRVARILESFSKGDTGTYTVSGVLGTVNGNEGIIVDDILPANSRSSDPGFVSRPVDVPVTRSVRSGLWSDPTTWEGAKVPGAGARVLVHEGHTVTYDINSDKAIRVINVAGTLQFATDKDTRLDVGLIKIQAGDEFSKTALIAMLTSKRTHRVASVRRCWSARRINRLRPSTQQRSGSCTSQEWTSNHARRSFAAAGGWNSTEHHSAARG